MRQMQEAEQAASEVGMQGGIESDRQNLLTRRDVVTDGQISLARNRYVIEPGQLFFSCSSVPAAHSLKLIRICAGANIVNRGRGKGRVEEERYDVLESV